VRDLLKREDVPLVSERHPRDAFITVYGRKPVLEVVEQGDVDVDKVVVDERARGPWLAELEGHCQRRGIPLLRASAKEVTRISRNAKQDQGCVADVRAPKMDSLERFLARVDETAGKGVSRGAVLLVLDGITTPANVGMILRVAAAAGLDGIVVPRVGVPEIGPLVIKASAGVAYRAPILRAPDAPTACDLLRNRGFALFGLDAKAPWDLFEDGWLVASGSAPGTAPSGSGAPGSDAPGSGAPRSRGVPTPGSPHSTPHHEGRPRVAFVLGGETHGLSAAVRGRLTGTVRLPMAPGVESLNVATAAAVVAYELRRRAITAVAKGRRGE
jgi:23S rRNA (guanosine2251-2'-O)-methyltransferase